MSDSERELDDVNFTDEAFDCLIKPFTSSAGGNAKVGKRDAQVLTLEYNAKKQFKEGFTTTGDNRNEIAVQTEKLVRENKGEDDEYYDDDEKPAEADLDGFEVTGLEQFLNRIYPKISLMLENNMNNHIFDSYDVIWDAEVVEDTELIHKLQTDYDFDDANNAT